MATSADQVEGEEDEYIMIDLDGVCPSQVHIPPNAPYVLTVRTIKWKNYSFGILQIWHFCFDYSFIEIAGFGHIKPDSNYWWQYKTGNKISLMFNSAVFLAHMYLLPQFLPLKQPVRFVLI